MTDIIDIKTRAKKKVKKPGDSEPPDFDDIFQQNIMNLYFATLACFDGVEPEDFAIQCVVEIKDILTRALDPLGVVEIAFLEAKVSGTLDPDFDPSKE